MTPDRWQKISEVFLAAAEQSAEGRAQFLSRMCGSDMALREEVESLLAEDARQTGFLRETADAALRVSRLAPPLEAGRAEAGMRVGSYQLVKQVASGGMGSVWLADRADEQFRGRAAVKLIKRGMDTDDILHRFRQERQVLANLRHPNICRLLDGGAAPDGRPYLVMDYVEGVAIDAYCDAKRLTVRQRLELFRRVCEAVQFAHQNLVVHRDLKPSNILVSEDGTPILLDFGIAKVIQPEGASATADMTAPQQRLMTPQYASPEQVKGQPITTATDVYSLGVILYELLTGRHPYRTTGTSLRDIEQAICDEAPIRPSDQSRAVDQSRARKEAVNADRTPTPTALAGPGIATGLSESEIALRRDTDVRHLRRQLSGDIDTIVLKALQKDPPRRYLSVEQLNNDIARHLGGLPVIARPDTITYRAAKFARRNRGMVFAGGLTAVTLLAATVVSLAFAAAADTQRKLAEQHAKETSQVAEFQSKMLSEIDAERMGRRLIDDLKGEVRSAGERANRETPEIDVRLKTLDDLLSGVNATSVAVRALDGNILSRALEAIDQQFAGQPTVQASLLQTVADTYKSLGLYDPAMVPQTRALEIRRRVLGVDHPYTLNSIGSWGHLLQSQGRLDDAEPYLREAMERFRSMLGDDHPNTMVSINSMGYLLQQQGKLDEAEPFLREVLERCRRVLGHDHLNTLSSINSMGYLLQQQGKLDEAEPFLREALERCRRVLGHNHPNTLSATINMGSLLNAQGKLDEAEPYFRQALENSRRVLGDDHPNTLISIYNMGCLLDAKGKPNEAREYVREALERQRRVLGDDHPDTLISINSMGYVLHVMGQPTKAIALLAPAEPAMRRTFTGVNALPLGGLLIVLGRSRAAIGEFEAAEANLREAHAILAEVRDAVPLERAAVFIGIVELYDAWHAANPGQGYDAKAAEWRAKLAEWQATTQPVAESLGRPATQSSSHSAPP